MVNKNADNTDSTKRQLPELPTIDRSEKRQQPFFDDGVMGHTFPLRKRTHPEDPEVVIYDYWDKEGDHLADGVIVTLPGEL